jgi:starch-binding outer membrane protein, SusD/RagB family
MIITRAEKPDIDWQGGSPENDLKNKNSVLANARLIRAWAYRHLTYSFGAVPFERGGNYRFKLPNRLGKNSGE